MFRLQIPKSYSIPGSFGLSAIVRLRGDSMEEFDKFRKSDKESHMTFREDMEDGGGKEALQALKMRDKLDEAIELAKEVNPAAKLVRISGLGINKNGTVSFEKHDDYVSRWEYAFCDDKDGEAPPQFVTVLYWIGGQGMVDPNAGNVSNEIHFDTEMIPQLKDSDVLARLFHNSKDYKKMCGNHADVIIYYMEKMMAPVAIIQNWKSQFLRLDPVSLERF
jgi:hypothetical protein